MKHLWWLAVPLHILSAQPCMPTAQTNMVTLTNTRPFLMSVEEFDRRLLAQARTKLIQQEAVIQVDHSFTLQRHGQNTEVTSTSTHAIANRGKANITNECYDIIRRDTRTSTIRLTGTVTPLPVEYTSFRDSYTASTNRITREEWIQFIPFAALYLIIFLR